MAGTASQSFNYERDILRFLFWGLVFFATAIGDLAAVWALRRIASTATVSDHPTKLGCVVTAA